MVAQFKQGDVNLGHWLGNKGGKGPVLAATVTTSVVASVDYCVTAFTKNSNGSRAGLADKRKRFTATATTARQMLKDIIFNYSN